MTTSRWMLKAALLAAPLGALTLSLPVGGAQAADIVDMLEEQQQFSTLAKAMEAAGIAQSLQGEGPYTVFAPTDQAFEQLPAGALDELMKGANQEQLKSLLQYHVVEGQKIAAKDAIGKQTDVETLAGERLSVDGTGQMVMLVPTGLTVARVGDQVYVERDVAAVTAPAVEVGPAGSDRQGQQQARSQSQQQSGQDEARTQTAEQSGMPVSEHQQQVLAGQPATEQQQTAPQAGDMPSSPHQEQVLRGQQGEEQAGQQAGTEQGSDMPSSPHQEQVLRGQQAGEQQGGQQVSTQQPQTAEADDMPSSPHQEQVLRGQQGAEQQRAAQGGQQEKGALREANVVEPDIEADNGVIHAIDAVLVPPSVLSLIEQPGRQQQSRSRQSSGKQG